MKGSSGANGADLSNERFYVKGDVVAVAFLGLLQRPGEELGIAPIAYAAGFRLGSGGGRIVLGVDEDKATHSHYIGGGVPSIFKKPNTVEWLNSLIPDLVEPRLMDFNVQAVKPAEQDSSIEPDKTVIVITVGDSEQAPHQSTRDMLFYGRLGASSQKLSHRFIMDIANRQKHPILGVEPIFHGSFGGAGKLFIKIQNTGKIAAKFILGELFISPPEVCKQSYDRHTTTWSGRQWCVLTLHNASEAMNSLSKTALSECFPLLPGRFIMKETMISCSTRLLTQETTEIKWKINADDAPVKCGGLPLKKVTGIREAYERQFGSAKH